MYNIVTNVNYNVKDRNFIRNDFARVSNEHTILRIRMKNSIQLL